MQHGVRTKVQIQQLNFNSTLNILTDKTEDYAGIGKVKLIVSSYG